VRRIVRRVIAVALIAPFFIPRLFQSHPIITVGVMLIGAILLGPDIAAFLSHAFDHILWSHRGSGRRPAYGVPLSLVQRGRFDEAIAAYEAIIDEYPDEIRPHMGLIDVAVVRLNDRALATKFYERSLLQLKNASDREKLKDIYVAICERWKDPSLQVTHTVAYRPADGPPRKPRES
jgi:hypothetical protein